MIGLWLDGLGDVERDRVIEAQGWMTGNFRRAGSACLLGHAYEVSSQGFSEYELFDFISIAGRFDRLVARFGMDRIVPLIKARAARGVTSRVVEPKQPPCPDPPRTDMAKALDKKLDVDAAAADIQRWSDKMRKNPIRNWNDVPPEGQELYRLLVYRVARSLVGDRDNEAVAGDLATKIREDAA